MILYTYISVVIVRGKPVEEVRKKPTLNFSRMHRSTGAWLYIHKYSRQKQIPVPIIRGIGRV